MSHTIPKDQAITKMMDFLQDKSKPSQSASEDSPFAYISESESESESEYLSDSEYQLDSNSEFDITSNSERFTEILDDDAKDGCSATIQIYNDLDSKYSRHDKDKSSSLLLPFKMADSGLVQHTLFKPDILGIDRTDNNVHLDPQSFYNSDSDDNEDINDWWVSSDYYGNYNNDDDDTTKIDWIYDDEFVFYGVIV